MLSPANIRFNNMELTIASLSFHSSTKQTMLTTLSQQQIKQIMLTVDLPAATLKQIFITNYKDPAYQFTPKDVMFLFRLFAAKQNNVANEDPRLFEETFPFIIKFKQSQTVTSQKQLEPSLSPAGPSQVLQFPQQQGLTQNFQSVIHTQQQQQQQVVSSANSSMHTGFQPLEKSSLITLPHPKEQVQKELTQKEQRDPSVQKEIAIPQVEQSVNETVQTVSNNEQVQFAINTLIDFCPNVQFTYTKDQMQKTRKQITELQTEIKSGFDTLEEILQNPPSTSADILVQFVQGCTSNILTQMRDLKNKIKQQKFCQADAQTMLQKLIPLQNNVHHMINHEKEKKQELDLQLKLLEKKRNSQQQDREIILSKLIQINALKVGFKLGYAQAMQDQKSNAAPQISSPKSLDLCSKHDLVDSVPILEPKVEVMAVIPETIVEEEKQTAVKEDDEFWGETVINEEPQVEEENMEHIDEHE
ncbi:Conserved_hypothetical protein [Hexamita inflata]|uniref:Uncharacterized protein n=1 Tax=Hexamita inflata TaxID=28002 RepID=A0AA86VDC0_9EUKA|nr:Conserved hypothetical protein [Hexamita inflata]